jgi:hypothetical protein
MLALTIGERCRVSVLYLHTTRHAPWALWWGPLSRSTEPKASTSVGQGQVRCSHAETLSLIGVPRLRGVIILLRLEFDGTLSSWRYDGRANLWCWC